MTQVLSKESVVEQMTWIQICDETDLIANSGVCALLPRFDQQSSEHDLQIAIYYLPQQNRVFALSNFDPIGKANVMYRGIIGSINDEPMVSSPLYKQHYSLISGECFENPEMRLSVFPCRIVNGAIEVYPQAVKQI